ncbi:MAG: hypothetical protein MUE71_02785 [Chitinophagaceae bacterium]|nr:hypothetical protein [Chitinophagaceae bacterium]
MTVHKQEHEKALSLLSSKEAIFSNQNELLLLLKGRSYFMSKNEKAYTYFKDSLKEVMSDKERYYALAVIHANTGKTKDAFMWLEKSVKAGFNYSRLLKYDPAWAALRKDPKWKSITAEIKPFPYKIN